MFLFSAVGFFPIWQHMNIADITSKILQYVISCSIFLSLLRQCEKICWYPAAFREKQSEFIKLIADLHNKSE